MRILKIETSGSYGVDEAEIADKVNEIIAELNKLQKDVDILKGGCEDGVCNLGGA